MPDNDKKFLKEHTETKRIKIEHKGVETSVARRIITVKRRGGVGSGAAGATIGLWNIGEKHNNDKCFIVG